MVSKWLMEMHIALLLAWHGTDRIRPHLHRRLVSLPEEACLGPLSVPGGFDFFTSWF